MPSGTLSGAEVRERYLRWFEERGHARLPSDSLVPANDPSLLFTGAGMNQFKDMFLGKGNLPHRRVTTAQKCLRVPDLENVGLTPRHHTFFEMLGNFSFGDYFKADCIPWVFGYYTEALSIPRERLVVTVYTDDDEAFSIWRDEVGIPDAKIYRFGEKENFWPASAPSQGPNGPCGPCSEVYYDLEPGGPLPQNAGLEALPDRFLEIGNCVFTQYDRQEDGSLAPLPQKNIDVGLGFERTVAVVQRGETNFDTDLFLPYLDWLGERSGKRYRANDADDVRLRRVADHARALAFCVTDGVVPSNEGRGYVVRKILRRACRDGYELGLEEPFLHELTGLVADVMGDAYGELRDARAQVEALLLREEKGFREIYLRGIERFEAWVATQEPASGPAVGSGAFAFELHDTHGFPVDITRQLLAERGRTLDENEFDAAMQGQRARARAGSAMTGEVFHEGFTTALMAEKSPPTRFVGYDALAGEGAILALDGADGRVTELAAPAQGECVVDQTPFYAEAGGQVGDQGVIHAPAGRARVTDCIARDGYHLQRVEVVEGVLRVGDPVRLTVDEDARRATERNHTATHILHRALKDIVGEEVAQAGSLVAPDRLRFDFTCAERVAPSVLERVEAEVNREIRNASPVEPVEMSLDDARAQGFVALFGEKYGATVRTLSVGAYSRELCGGTHVRNSGEIGYFRILQESSIAAGVRRIEAIAGAGAVATARDERRLLDTLAVELKAPLAEIHERLGALKDECRGLRRELDEARRARGGDQSAELERVLRSTPGGARLAATLPGADHAALLDLMDRLRKKHSDFAGVLFGPGDGQVAVVAAAAKSIAGSGVDAGQVVRELCGILGGGGGGRPALAQGRGRDAAKLDEALARAWVLLGADGP